MNINVVWGYNHVPKEFDGQPEKFDEIIRNIMEGAGFKWIGQGMCFATRERDMTFELKAEEVAND